MTTNIVRGLHTCKPHNAPSVGQIKSFMLLPMNVGTDKEWTKIKNEAVDKGGQYFRVVSAEKTTYSDQNGNISFNLVIEPANAPAPTAGYPYPGAGGHPPQNHPAHQNGFPASPERPVDRSEPSGPQDSAQQHIMRAANLYSVCLGVAATTVRDVAQKKGFEFSPEDIRQVATTLFLNAASHGYIAHMGDKEKKEPY